MSYFISKALHLNCNCRLEIEACKSGPAISHSNMEGWGLKRKRLLRADREQIVKVWEAA